jgi:chemotaxis-related protein WspD
VFSRASRDVLEKCPPVGYISQWAENIAMTTGEMNKDTFGVMVFRIGNEWYSLPANSLQVVTEKKTIHSVPHNGYEVISGIANIDGEVRLCFSLSRILGLDVNNNLKKTTRKLIVVSGENDEYVFPVEDVKGITRYSPADLNPIPVTIEKSRAQLLSGVFNLDNVQVAVIDIQRLDENIKAGLL